MQQLLSNSLNMSDKSPAFCNEVIKIHLEADLLMYLKNDALKPSKLNDEIVSVVVEAILCILYNTIQHAPAAVESLRKLDAVAQLQPFRECPYKMILIVTLMITSFLVTEEENEKNFSSSLIFELFITLLKCSMINNFYKGVSFDPIEIVDVINKLAVYDSNKKRILEAGTLPLYIQLMKPSSNWDDKVTGEVVHGLWILGLKCRDDIIKQPGCLNSLRELVNHSDENVKKQAERALCILDEKYLVTDDKKVTNSGQHVFISYQWEYKNIVLRIRDRLKKAGIKTWIDEDDMTGSVIDAMAFAVENASVVIICLSQKYKDSASCKTEAEYAFRIHKPIIPLRLQAGYYPDGWLGLLVGSKLVFDISIQNMYEDSVRKLIKELKHYNKHGVQY